MKFVLLGAGQRGMIYAQYAHELGHEIVAVAEPVEAKREAARKAFSIAGENCFERAEQLLARECMADAAIIATMDRDHWGQAIPAIRKGYHLLLEKPISPVPEETLEIADAVRKYHRHAVVCHVLRYSPFFREIKRIIDSGELGRVVSIDHNENIGNFHIAHSFVRGNWRRKDLASSLIMQKSCHDMDLLVWLVGSGCRQLASFGSLTYFKAENAPQGATERCVTCPHKDTCRFSAYKAYMPVMGSWPATVLTEDQTPEGLQRAIAEGSYGRCVFHCDNDVCDHQVTAMEFDNGVTATFNLSGFTNRMARTIKIMCEDGEIQASEFENTIRVIPFAANGVDRCESRVIEPMATSSGHGGGDSRIVEDFLALMEGRAADAVSSIEYSVESHMMACAAEESRLSGEVIRIAEYRKQHTRRQDV